MSIIHRGWLCKQIASNSGAAVKLDLDYKVLGKKEETVLTGYKEAGGGDESLEGEDKDYVQLKD